MPEKFKIFVTRKIHPAGLNLLKKQKNFQIKISPHDRVLKRKELLVGVKGCDAILSLLTDLIDGRVMKAAGPQLKIVANYAVGFDNIKLADAKKRKVIITNAPSEKVSVAVAEHTFAFLMSLARRIVEADDFTRALKYKGWDPLLLIGEEIYGKTLGIVGLGRIGREVCRRAALGFGMKILYNDIKRDPKFEKQFKAKFVKNKNNLLRQVDFVSLHVPLLPATKHLISKEELKIMKKTAYLINTSRGPVVDETALLKALAQNQIAGAALDVFECEPEIDCNTHDRYELRKMSNVIITPHIASATDEARGEMSIIAAKNIITVLGSKKPLTPAK